MPSVTQFTVVLDKDQVYHLDVERDSSIDQDNLEEELVNAPKRYALYSCLQAKLEEREAILTHRVEQIYASQVGPTAHITAEKYEVELVKTRKNIKFLRTGKRAVELKNIALTTLLGSRKRKEVEVDNTIKLEEAPESEVQSKVKKSKVRKGDQEHGV